MLEDKLASFGYQYNHNYQIMYGSIIFLLLCLK